MIIKNILLIMPPFSMEQRYGKGIKKIGTVLPSLGLLYLAAELERFGFNVKIFDSQLYDWDVKQVGEYCRNTRADIMGVYCNTSNYQHSVELSKELKINSSTPIIFGGPHVSTRPLEVLSNDSIDYIVMGEGERTIIELMNALNRRDSRSLRDIQGIGFKENGQPVINPPRAPIQDLDSIPFPARHLIPREKYKASPNHYRRLPMATMMASRGCPFRCTFCDVQKIWPGKYRFRSVKNVVDEIKYLIRDYGIKEIKFWDDSWGANKEWAREFCHTVISQGLDVSWSAQARVNTIDREILKKMKQAGCWCIFFGIESLNQETLEAINKQVTLEQITNALKWTREAGIEVIANFILGLPKETPEKVKRMLKKLCKLNPDYVKFNILTPYPETVLYKEIKQGKWGTMVDASYDKLTGYFATFFPYGYKNLDELKKMKRYAFRKYYFRLGYILPRLFSIRSLEDLKRHIRGARAILSL